MLLTDFERVRPLGVILPVFLEDVNVRLHTCRVVGSEHSLFEREKQDGNERRRSASILRRNWFERKE